MIPSFLLALLVSFFSSYCLADSVELPSVKEGDTWTYRETIEKGAHDWKQTNDEMTVVRVTSSSIYMAIKQSGSTQEPREKIAGLDWSIIRSVNGKETVVNQPLSFPLYPGKTWEIKYTEEHPNKQHKLEQIDHHYQVIGYETVTVPAGTFNALKIEVEGKWFAELEPGQNIAQTTDATQTDTTMVTQVKKVMPSNATGRTYKAFWYAPETKRWVKSLEEYYSSKGERNQQYLSELEAYKLAN